MTGRLTADVSRVPTWNRAWSVALALVGAIALYHHAYRVAPAPLPEALASFPRELKAWRGEDIDPRSAPMRAAGADEELVRIYRDGAGHAVGLYVGYFESQGQGRELVSYVLRDIHRTAVEEELQAGPGRVYRVNRALIGDPRDRRLVIFWYDIAGQAITGRSWAKLTTAANFALRRRANGALVAVWLLPGQPEPGEAERAFMGLLIPRLRERLS